MSTKKQRRFGFGWHVYRVGTVNRGPFRVACDACDFQQEGVPREAMVDIGIEHWRVVHADDYEPE